MTEWMSAVRIGGSAGAWLVVALTLGSAACSGEDGAPGQSGPQGEQGQKGEMGAPGETGAKGETGPRGEAGPPGEPGAAGEDGAPGIDGAKGDDGAQGDDGVKGDTGGKGDTGAKGDPGDAGYFVLKDGAGKSLGTIVTMQQGLFLVRGPEDALLYYSMNDGNVVTASGRFSDPLYFTSTNCTGTPLIRAALVDASAINDGKLYKATLPYATVTRHSEKNDETGLCIPATSTEPFMVGALIGAAPSPAVMPLTVE